MLSPTISQEQAQLTQTTDVINLSSYIISNEQQKVLSRGLGFAPTYHFNLHNTIKDVNRFVWLLTVKKNFFDNTEEEAYIHTETPMETISNAEDWPVLFRDIVSTKVLQELQEESLDPENQNNHGA